MVPEGDRNESLHVPPTSIWGGAWSKQQYAGSLRKLPRSFPCRVLASLLSRRKRKDPNCCIFRRIGSPGNCPVCPLAATLPVGDQEAPVPRSADPLLSSLIQSWEKGDSSARGDWVSHHLSAFLQLMNQYPTALSLLCAWK